MKVIKLNKDRVIEGQHIRAGVPTPVEDHTAIQIEQSRWGAVDHAGTAKAIAEAAKATAAAAAKTKPTT